MRAGGGFVQSVTGCSVKISPHYVAYVEGLSLTVVTVGLNKLLIVISVNVSEFGILLFGTFEWMLYSSQMGRFCLCVCMCARFCYKIVYRAETWFDNTGLISANTINFYQSKCIYRTR